MMVNTYDKNASMEEKMYEETRCLRSVMERILRVMNDKEFVDYQMEKFGKEYKSTFRSANCDICHYPFTSHHSVQNGMFVCEKMIE